MRKLNFCSQKTNIRRQIVSYTAKCEKTFIVIQMFNQNYGDSNYLMDCLFFLIKQSSHQMHFITNILGMHFSML